jgi:pectate lyase
MFKSFPSALLGCAVLCTTAVADARTQSGKVAAAPLPAFPGAQGWARNTPGGRGGRIVRVTTLADTGPGSFREAVATKGPKIIVFEVAGTIDLNRRDVRIDEPFVTVAGQTSPNPGVTFIRGGFDVATHDVVIQHIRVRPGDAGQKRLSGWEVDSISAGAGAYDVIVDHCTFMWGTDENMSASGPRFVGATPDDWRKAVSHRVTFSNNLMAEGLRASSHSKGEHSKGSLIHDNVSEILFVNNLWSSHMERHPLIKGGGRIVEVNNLIYNPGHFAVHYYLAPQEWRGKPYQNGQLALVGNVMRGGPDTEPGLALLMVGGSGDLDLFADDNIVVDQRGNALPLMGRYTTSRMKVNQAKVPPLWPEGLKAMPAWQVQDHVLANAGARPWQRDPTDFRIVSDVIEGRSEVIDSQDEVGGYPQVKEVRRAFDPAEWDMRFMTPRDPTEWQRLMLQPEGR